MWTLELATAWACEGKEEMEGSPKKLVLLVKAPFGVSTLIKDNITVDHNRVSVYIKQTLTSRY